MPEKLESYTAKQKNSVGSTEFFRVLQISVKGFILTDIPVLPVLCSKNLCCQDFLFVHH